MKKILVVITTAFVGYGGLTNAYMNYYRAMNKEGLKIDIVSFNNPEKELVEEIESNGGKYIQLPDKRRKILQYLSAFKDVCKNYDVVHVHGNSATMVGELFISKIAGVTNRIAHNHTTRSQHPIMNWICKPLFWRSYTIGLAVSEKAAQYLYSNQSHIVLNNTIDSDRYIYNADIRKQIRKAYGIEENTFIFGHVGKIYEAKNHPFLIELFAELVKRCPNSKLMLVGDGPMKEKIVQKAIYLDVYDRVIFTGMRNDVCKYYSAMDLFLVPSHYEGFSLVSLEAQASGLFCVLSDAIPKEIDITTNVLHLPLEQQEWVANIVDNVWKCSTKNRFDISEYAIKEIKSAGYDSFVNSEKLRKLYLKDSNEK